MDTTKKGRLRPSSSEGAGGKRCERCGLQCNRFSIANHDKWCRESQEETKRDDRSAGRSGEVVARVVTLGLTPGKPDFAYVRAPKKSSERKPPVCSTNYQPPKSKTRPSTTTLKDSKLQKTGHGVPSQSSESSGSGLLRCKKCTRLVASNRLDTHIKVCEADSGKARAIRSSSVQRQPSQAKHQLQPTSPKQDPDHSTPEVQSQLVPGHTLKFVICYICAREYTVHSIGIHVPQCTKKFHAENEKLPIRQRRPFPKKPEPRVVLEDNRVVGGASVDVDTAVKNYYEHCYTTFEDTLVPCRVCGRTFAADRHRIHEPNCKAKPIAKRS